MVKQCKVIVTVNNNIFRSPEPVSGKVALILTSPMKCKGVFVSVCGEGAVTLDVGRVMKQALERYVYIKETVCGPGVLSAGTHTFPFSFNLPPSVPNTFLNYPSCHVHYYCEASIVRAFKADIICQKFFTYISTLDLNQIPHASKKVVRETRTSIGWHGDLLAKCQLEKGGYVAGESVMVNVEISNQSRMTIVNSETYLVMKCLYKVEGHTRESMKIIDHCNNNHHIPPDQPAVWTNIMKIPSNIPPSGLGYPSNIITLDYYIYVNIEPRRALLRTSLKLPITIGTIALLHLSPPSYNEVMSGSPPPCYEDCIFEAYQNELIKILKKS